MSKFFSQRLTHLAPYVPGEQPKDIKNLIKLNTNESPFAPSPKAVEAGKRASERLHLYSDPTATALKRAIAKVYGVSENQITVSNGSDEVLAFLFEAFCDDGAIINDITYGFYKVFASVFGVKTTVIPLKEDYSIDVKDYEGKKGTVFIANPNAPTGIALSLDEIERLLSQDTSRLVVVDEAYVDFGADSALALLDRYDNLVVVRTFSKSRSLAGARIGYAFSSEQIISDIERVRNSFNPYNLGSVAIAMGEASMLDVEYFEKNRLAVMENRERLVDGLKEQGFTVLDSKANFIFATPPDGDGEKLYKGLRERSILVRYFNSQRLSAFARITVGSKEQVDALLTATAQIYGEEK